MDNKTFQNERHLAVMILTDITERGAYANQALRKSLNGTGLLARDKAFITEIVNETVRNMLRIDRIISEFSTAPLVKMKPFILNLLRVSVCQIRFMDKVPPSAAVNEAVELVKHQKMNELAGFVNGVLRNIVRNPDSPALPPLVKLDPSYYIAAKYSYPEWLAELLVESVGAEAALAAAEAGHIPPVVTVYTNTLKIKPEDLAARLTGEGIECEPGALHRQCLRLKHTSDIARSPSFKEGLFFVIDEGAVSAVNALGLAPGMNVLDMCAAPGGKTFAAACMMEGGGTIHAWDLHPHKIALLEKMAAQLGLENIRAKTADALVPDESLHNFFDAVLLDAPCSGFGIIRKKPDIKLNRKPGDLVGLAASQRGFLEAASDYVKPGGLLVYCTCTLTREENGNNLRWFVRNFPFTKETETLLLPTANNDGFFIAGLRKKS